MFKTLSKNKLIRDISASTAQTIITQSFTVIVFYLMSKYLPKQDFGEFNWAVALGFTIISFASLGLDLVFVKRVAAGEDVITVSGIHFFHTLLVGAIICAATISLYLAAPGVTLTHPALLFIFFNIALINIANSFKLGLNGLESYRALAFLALWTNVVKLGGCLALFFYGSFSLYTVIGAFIASSFIELMAGYYYLNRAVKKRVKPLLRIAEYKYFILESLPQLGVVIFDSTLSRLDIILLGALSTDVITADYSFAYKIYELSKLPIIIIGPILLTRFSKFFSRPGGVDLMQKKEIRLFFQFELFLIMFIPLFLIALWSPLMSFFTDGKYGPSNEAIYLLLAPCVPLVCMVNFLWTLGFVQGQLKTIMYITMVVTGLNILCNVIAIPIYGGIGSACSFLFSSVLQVVLYLVFIKKRGDFLWLWPCAIIFGCAVLSAFAGRFLTNNPIFEALISTLVYVLLIFFTRQINFSQALSMLANKQKNTQINDE